MTDKKRQRHIRIETHEVTIIRDRAGKAFELCAECQAMVNALSPNEAALEIQNSVEDIETLISSGEIHLVEQPDSNRLLICANSLGNKNT